MLLIGPDDVRKAVEEDIQSFLDSLAKGLEEKSLGRGWYPSRLSTDLPKGWIGIMPAFSSSSDVVAVKIVGVFPDNPDKGLPTVPAVVVLLDANDGRALALIDGFTLTEYRTGGASAVSARYLARKDSESMLVIGAGTQGRSHSRLIPEVLPIKKVYVMDVNEERAKALSKEIRSRGVDSEVVNSPRPADVMVTVTTSRTPVLTGEHLVEGSHVCAVGAYTPDARELDDTAIKKFDRIVVDTMDSLKAGDLAIPISKGLINPESVYELGEVIAGRKPGRESYDEITLYKSVGTSALDVAAAAHIYYKSLELGLGRKVEWGV